MMKKRPQKKAKRIVRLIRWSITGVLLIVLIVLLVRYSVAMRSTRLALTGIRSTAAASEQPELVDELREGIESRALPMVWAESMPESTDDLTLLTITLDVRNAGSLDAEWVEVDVEPQQGDIAMYELIGKEMTIPARGSGTLVLKLLTSAPQEATRRITVSYYVQGTRHSVMAEG